MLRNDPESITQLLSAIGAGDDDAAQALLPLVYGELRVLAQSIFAGERNDHTLQPTALIHEAWLKLAGHLAESDNGFSDRHHFFVVAARAMRQVLGDHARRCRAQKRGDGAKRVTLAEGAGPSRSAGFDLVEFDDSLTRLGRLNARHAQVVELRILGGLTIAESAAALGVSHNTIETDWFMAKAWLRSEFRSAQ